MSGRGTERQAQQMSEDRSPSVFAVSPLLPSDGPAQATLPFLLSPPLDKSAWQVPLTEPCSNL